MQERLLDDWTGPKIGPCPNLPQSIAASRIPLPSGGAFMPLKDLWCTCQSLSNAATKHPDHFASRGSSFASVLIARCSAVKKYGT